VRKKVH